MTFIPLDGQITSLQTLSVLSGSEVQEIVSPGTAAGGNNYQISLTTLAAFYANKTINYSPSWFLSAKVFETINVNFSNAGDTPFPIILPLTFTRYLVSAVRISGASASISAATAGLFTGAGGAGTSIITAASAISVNTAADNTVNNAMAFTINSQNTQSYAAATVPTLFFRVVSTAPATANITLELTPLP